MNVHVPHRPPTHMYLSRRLSARAFSTSAPRFALSPAALSKAERISAEWKGTSATGGTTKNFIGGEWLESKASEWIDVVDPVSPLILSLLYAECLMILVDTIPPHTRTPHN